MRRRAGVATLRRRSEGLNLVLERMRNSRYIYTHIVRRAHNYKSKAKQCRTMQSVSLARCVYADKSRGASRAVLGPLAMCYAEYMGRVVVMEDTRACPGVLL
jgi:hypothetical protein